MPVSIGAKIQPGWPNRRRLSSQVLQDGRVLHVLAHGAAITVNAAATQRLNYISTWVGTLPNETYAINVSVIGVSEIEGFFDAWNHDIDEWRSYRFDKTVSIVDLKTGSTFAGHEFKSVLPPR